MTSPSQAEEQVRRLLDLAHERSLSLTERDQFIAALQADAAVRRVYRDLLKIEAILQWELSAVKPVSGVEVRQSPMAAPGPPSAVRLPLLGNLIDTIGRILPGGDIVVGGLVLLAVFGAVWGIVSYMHRDRPVEIASTSPVDSATARSKVKAGSIQADAQAVWSAGTPQPVKGEVYLGQRCQLAAGRVEMKLADGTQLIISARADWKIDADHRLLLDSGQIVAFVPAAASGFTVVTPTAEIVDLGTKFVVEVTSAEETHLAVNRGCVRLTTRDSVAGGRAAPAPADSDQLVTAGQALIVSRTGEGGVVVRESAFDSSWVAELVHMGESLAITPDETIAFEAVFPGPAGDYPCGPDAVGMDFGVSRPIRIFSLGVFDHLGDGIDPQSTLTVQLWSRDDQGTPENMRDDKGLRILSEASFTALQPGVLRAGYRFKPLPQPIVLERGSYTLTAFGFVGKNKNFSSPLFNAPENEHRGIRPQPHVETCRFAIFSTGWRFTAIGLEAAGHFPDGFFQPLPMFYFASSFTFAPVDDN